ncbi:MULTISPECIES: zinc-binding dehydrogenase [unclassified Luteococcus]|uniref:zinc-binding dehydrogenase n=1 Tax=unclassified Luteococcus TaxID=2639923 RepID=UPI00313E428F
MTQDPTARAAVWTGQGFDLRTLPLPHPAPGEVLVEVGLAGICGSDRHTVAGRRPAPCPSILGHESVGRIQALGGVVHDVSGRPLLPGQRVVWGVAVACGSCDRCAAGLSAKCRTVRKVGHEPFDGQWPLSGGYASHLLLPAGSALVAVPEPMDNRAAALTSCAVATAVTCVETAENLRGRPLQGSRALVVGAGALGVAACAALHELGSTVWISDPNPERAAQAMSFGADQALAEGTRVDLAIDFSGVADGVRLALDRLDLAGVAVLAGTVAPGHEVQLDPERVVRNYWRIAGVHNYEPRHLLAAVGLVDRTRALGWERLTAPPEPLSELARLVTSSPSDPRVLRSSVAP